MYSLARPALFALDPEHAHSFTLGGLQRAAPLARRLYGDHVPADRRTIMGLCFPNPVGLAAGLDKDGACIDGLAALGFGFLELGTVTPRPQPGNPRPRLFRLPAHRALINRLGFNNQGVDALVRRLQASRFRGVLGVNIGKNFDTPLAKAVDDYRHCLARVYPYASYVTVNISSPNTAGLRDLQGGDSLATMLRTLKADQARLADDHSRYVPLAVKIAPDLTPDELDGIAAAVSEHGVDAVITTNTTTDRDAVAGAEHADEQGGLSGEPLRATSTRVVAYLTERLSVPVIGVGGVLSGADAREKLAAGASLVQIYTGLIYRGPGLVNECVRQCTD